MTTKQGMTLPTNGTTSLPEESVRDRYSDAAKGQEPALCCPVTYDAKYLAAIPQEIIERDYGCGNPAESLKPGETVIDLGSGTGKACYIAAQVVGPQGRVIGVDCNQEMLALARKYRQTVADKLGYANVEFRCGMIQDLQLDLDKLSTELARHPVKDHQDWLQLRSLEDRLRQEEPLIADDSVDCIISSCVLNLVRPQDRQLLFSEMFRVLKRHGRVAISDIVADEDVPERLQRDPKLWSGCISGAFREDLLLKAFEDAGFHGIHIVERQAEPWQTVEGIEFRSVTVVAYKGKQGVCWERKQAVIYNGPFKKVEDDDGHIFRRGERTAVCDKTFHLLQLPPYDGLFDPVEPRENISLEDAKPFDCRRNVRRDPRETKGQDYGATITNDDSCCDPGCC